MMIRSPRSVHKQIHRMLVGFALAAGLSGCDRGWVYRAIGGVPIMANGLRFDVDGPADTRYRVYASLFTVHLRFDIDLQNVGRTPLQVRPDNLFLIRGSEAMPVSWSHRCEGRKEAEVVLAPGESCLMRAGVFASQSDTGLSELTVVHFGVSRAGNPVQVLIPLERL